MPYLMKCGHVANAESNGKPCCIICVGITSDAFVIDRPVTGRDGLEGRKAKCTDCGCITDSSWNLPFFKYCPDSEYDRYYCGCYGWD